MKTKLQLTAKQSVFLRIQVRASKGSGMRLKTRVRLLRHALPISLLILRKKPTVLQSKASTASLRNAFRLQFLSPAFVCSV